MIKYVMTSIRDDKVGFMQPICEPNVQSAVRNFEHAVSREDTLFYSHASDYSLYHVADFDVDSGVISPVNPPEFIVSAASLKGEK